MTQHLRGLCALLAVTVVWGTTFPVMKDLTGHFSASWIIFVRFAIAALLLSPFLMRGTRADISSGVALGALLFLCYAFQVEGLALTSSNRNAFITGLNVLVVPLIGLALGRRPDSRIVLALVLALAGLAALCWDGGPWTRGDTLALMCAMSFGAYILMMESHTRRATSLITMTAMQILTVAFCAGAYVLLKSRAGLALQGGFYEGLRQAWLSFAYLGVVCTAAIISLQTWGQRRTSANEAAVIYAFEPAAAAVFGFFWLGETMTPRGWLGAALLISGMIVSQWDSQPRPVAALAPE